MFVVFGHKQLFENRTNQQIFSKRRITMLDHPQDAYRLARDHQIDIRNYAKIDRIFQPLSKEQRPISNQEWKKTLLNLRKLRVEFSLLVQKR